MRKGIAVAEPTHYTVPATTIDAYCKEKGVTHVSLIKIDAEGYDLNVLEGASGLLAAEDVDIFMFEFASGWAATKRYLWEAVEYMDPMPYKLFRLFNGFLCPLAYAVRKDSRKRIRQCMSASANGALLTATYRCATMDSNPGRPMVLKWDSQSRRLPRRQLRSWVTRCVVQMTRQSTKSRIRSARLAGAITTLTVFPRRLARPPCRRTSRPAVSTR